MHLLWHNPQFLYLFLYWAVLSSFLYFVPLFHNLCFGHLDVLLVWEFFLGHFGVFGGFFGGEGLQGAGELLSILFKEVLPTVSAVVKLLCILRVWRAHKPQIHPSVFTWVGFGRGEVGNGMQFNFSFNEVPSWGHIKQKEPVFVPAENHTDRALQSDREKARSANKPCPHLPETVPWHCPVSVLPLLNYTCLGCCCHRSLEQLPSFRARLLVLWPSSLSQMSTPVYTCRISISSFLGRPNLSVTGNLHHSRERQEPSC